MASVPTTLAEWLKSPALYTSVTNAALSSGLLTNALDSEIISPLATKGATDTELARQIAILGGPIALDQHIVKGARRDLICKPITLVGDRLGYSAGVIVFVVEANEQDDGTTSLLVVRKLA